MSENKYRDYLENDKTFYRQYLKNEDEPVGTSSFVKFTMGAAATIGLAAGTAAAYRHGAFRGQLEHVIGALGKFRQTRLGDTLDSIRNWTKDDQWTMIDEMDGSFNRIGARLQMFGELPNYLAQGSAKRLVREATHASNPIIQDKPFELHSYIKQMESTLARQREARDAATTLSEKVRLARLHRGTERLFDQTMEKLLVASAEQQANMVKRTGFQQATVQDVWSYLPPEVRAQLQRFEDKLKVRDANYSVMDKVMDTNLLVKKGSGQPQFADLRDFRDSIAKTGDMIAEDFTIPFIKINPVRMFYLNEFTKHDTPVIFADMSKSTSQFFAGKNFPTNAIPKETVFMNGRMYMWDDATKGFTESDNVGYLVNSRNDGTGSLLARNTKNMMNLHKTNFVPSEGWKWLKDSTGIEFGFRRNIWEPIMGNILGFGRQVEPIGHNMDIGDVASYGSPIARFLNDGVGPWGGLRTYGTKVKEGSAFAPEQEWLFIQRFKTLKEVNAEGGSFGDFSKQFFAARNQPDNVTTASFFLYTAMERINATLNQVNLGLNSKYLGSAQSIFGNLMLRRVAPVALGIEGIKYTNYAWEQATGDEYEDDIARGVVNSQIKIARVAEKTGFTDAMKEAGRLMPGFEFISELPVPVITTEGLTPIMLKDILPLDKTADELKDYYNNGEEAVRKGRYWEFGNTPITGSKVDYFQPNWYRRITSDWQYTETLWGSKEEYWENSWIPNPTNPLAPIKHFFTDPYHWEKKHYEDRPYMLTGGIPEIENFPLFGPLANATVGQLLKPQMKMHEDEWNNPGYYQNLTGFQLAESLGIIEGNIGGASQEGGIVGAHSGFGGFYGSAAQSFGVGDGTAATAFNNQSTRSGYAGNIMAGNPIAYVTSSGNVSVMQTQKEVNLNSINQALAGSGIGKAGAATELRMQFPDFTTNDPEDWSNPGGINMALTDFYYNTTEVNGFYGWQTGLITNQSASEWTPRVMTSTKAFGYQRAFWDSDYGNMGADGMEIFRRFLTRDANKNYISTLDNNMPTWLPGPEYFQDFQTGDPYVKVKKGEMRLPGESYERLYGLEDKMKKAMDLEIGPSFIGYDTQTIINHWLHRDDIKDAAFQDILDAGTDIHKQIEKEFRDQGITVASEQYVEDKAHKIGGFYDGMAKQDELLKWAFRNGAKVEYYRGSIGGERNQYEGYYEAPVEVTPEIASEIVAKSPMATIDYKTRSQKQFDRAELHYENAQQINFYAKQLQTGINAVVELNRDDPSQTPHVFLFDYNESLYNHTMDKVETARAAVRQMMKDGAIGRGDLYDQIDRYRILADVAPYSEEFRKLKAQLSLIDLSDEEKQEIQTINDQVHQRKDAVRTYDYRFKTANVKNMVVTVKEVIDNNTFLTEEFGDNPIRFAGVYIPTGQDEKGQAATELLQQYVTKGRKLTIGVTQDPLKLVKNDTYHTIDAVVRAGDIKNLNQELIRKGLAKEKEDDYSPAAVHARFSPEQIAFGSTWETIAHWDTPIHTKFLQVRSPLEQYRQREVYGKDWQDWANPVDDYAIPWYQNWISKSPFPAITMGMGTGYLFGHGGTHGRFGRIMGALIGGTAAALGVSYVKGLEMTTGETWIPERRRKEREIEEYFDMLKFVKYRGLYEQASQMAMKKEGFNVKAYMKRQQMDGDGRKKRLHDLQEAKRNIVTGKDLAIVQARKLVGAHDSVEEYKKALNQEIEAITNTRKATRITPIAAQAIQFYQESEKTMYAYDAGDPLENILAALPRKERIYFNKFLEAPEEERQGILDVVPSYVKRALQSSWGMKVDPKPDLYQYFQKHGLPNANWSGWDPRANLSDIKLRVVKHEGMDLSEFNMWPEDEKRADMIKDQQVPDIHQETNVGVIKQRLRDILGEAGMKNLNIEVERTKEKGVHMNMNIHRDRRDDIIKQMNEHGYSLVD